jgi:threonine/homoserine/homoserine lactone efflux protein
VIYPVPWARDPSLSALATPEEMRALLAEAGFAILAEQDTTDACVAWFRGLATQGASPGIQLFMGADFPQMVRNQVQNLTERRIRVVTYVCRG